jgi:hypothetical protein
MLQRALRALLIQLGAALLVCYFVAPLAQPLRWSALQAVAALVLAGALRQRGMVLWLHGLFGPLMLAALWLALPPWLYLLAFVLTYAVSRNAITERVPLYLSSRESIAALAAWLPPGARVLDLGSGDGRVVLGLAQLRPDVQVAGVENAFLPWCWSRCHHLLGGRVANVQLHYGSFWHQDWSTYDVVHAFLSPVPMGRVWQHFLNKCHANSYLVSNTFTIDSQEPDQRLPLHGVLQKELLIWRHPNGTS